MRGGLVVLACAALAAPGTAHAGRTFYGWLYGTEVMPERGAELLTWVAEENKDAASNNSKETIWWFGALTGVTDQLELAFPIELAWERSDVKPGHFTFDRYGVEARYRFVTQDPEEAPPFVPLVRVAVKRIVGAREVVRPEADLIASFETGIVHMLVDLGYVSNLSADAQEHELRPGAGVSVLAVGDLRFGAEFYSELKFAEGKKSWGIVGPNLAWTHGRFWLSATYGIGLFGIKNAPKLQWGIAF